MPTNVADPVVRAGAVATRGNDLLVVRGASSGPSGEGPRASDAANAANAANAAWSVPSVAVRSGETLAEAVARAVRTQTGLDALGAPFLGWYEQLPSGAGRSPEEQPGGADHDADGVHQIVMCFGAVVMDDGPPTAGLDVVEARWMAVWDFSELPIADGLAELLAEHGIIDTLT